MLMPFIIIGSIGLLVLVISLVVGDVFDHFEIGEGALSGTALGIAAVVFGASGVFWARDRSVAVTPTVVRASAGATERLPLCQVTNLARALAQAKEAGFWVVGTVAEDGADLRRLAADGMPDALVVVLGSEGHGLRRLTRDSCDFLATIPGTGGVASLNVSAAAAVTLATLCTPAPAAAPIEPDDG